ncbi:hypothetical protein M9Y10_025154 [Tritrichomonas musculus]|uniref:Uncharacterized protein n=1 Tax=Tritrichomonas musculus TaxID=1915356 RepID=A0ABR2HAN3_9EUKA
MEIEAFIKKMKDINSALLDFFDSSNESGFETLIEILEKNKLENKEEFRLLFQLVSKISSNHHRTSGFFDKLEKIFKYLFKDFPSSINIFDFIPDFTKYNKRILFLLLEKKLIKPDAAFVSKYLRSKRSDYDTFHFLYPTMKEFYEEEKQKQIEKDIFDHYGDELPTFEEKCRIGENDSYLCSLIRSDSIEEFVSYVNRTNLSLSVKIDSSIYETNSFLIGKEPKLIEYAAFFGSIQIIQYLKYNNVPLTSSLWLYAVHSNSAELIHFLEENNINKTTKQNIEDILIESIKCHHNDISNYIKDNFYEQNGTDFQDHFNETIINSLNFFFFPDKVESMFCKPEKTNGFNLNKLGFLFTQVTIHSSATSIENTAFYGCSVINQIRIPSSVVSIENAAFYGCSSLTQISFDTPSSLNSIGNSAFVGCSKLIQILIPSSVTSIGNAAFYGCSSLKQIIIPSSVTSIGNAAFYGCSSLTQISFETPSSLNSIGNGAFVGCSKLTGVSIPSSVTSGKDTLYGCLKLIQKMIPFSEYSIGLIKEEKGEVNTSPLIDIIRKLSIPIKTEEGCSQKYILPSFITQIDPVKKIRRITIGPQISSLKDEIKILIFGASSSGKTLFLNRAVNYIYGVKWTDNCRFKIALDENQNDQFGSQIDYVTAYTLYWQPGFAVPYTVTLIDTPEFGYERFELDMEIVDQLKSFFMNEKGNGIDNLNAVTFIIKSDLNAQSSKSLKFIYDSITKMFGNDIANNINIVVSYFSGYLDMLLYALKYARIPTTYLYNFNNGEFAETDIENDAKVNKELWKFGQKDYENFFNDVAKMSPKKLNEIHNHQ